MTISTEIPAPAVPSAPVELTEMERGLIDAMLELYYGIPQKPPSVAVSEPTLIVGGVVPSKPRRAKSRPKNKRVRAMQPQPA